MSKKAGIWGLSQGHTAIWFDANQDGWPDLYIANDFETPDRFYMNKGDGTFTDVVDQRLAARHLLLDGGGFRRPEQRRPH